MTQRNRRVLVLAAVSAALLLLSVSTTSAQFFRQKRFFRANLVGLEEVPAVSSTAEGQFSMLLTPDEQSAAYRLTYSGIATGVLFAHIHFGNEATNGGVSVWLCDNSGNGPVGTPACPQGEGTVSGTITAENVVGPTGQGIDPGELQELIAALRAGAAYVNVHSEKFGGGEIRGQVR